MQIFYLHGFASSARSSKATYLAAKLTAHRVTLHAPDFNPPDFSTLTITRMIEQTLAAIDVLPQDEEVVLVGSSLGGFVAVQVALARPQRISRLVLLAPALDFAARSTSSGPSGPFDSAQGRPEHVEGRAESSDANRTRGLGADVIEQWKQSNSLPVFHYGFGRMMNVHYELYTDAQRYDSVNAALTMPIQVFQGRSDDAVDPAAVEAWARARPNAELHLLDDGHQLTVSLDYIWGEMERFLALPRLP
jgi:pimeloyl-ACP methyl ester carboxylesterase